jgi:hypothetical protein
VFIGYPRSGHTLVGFLLDAHPNVIVASQTSALRYFRHGFSAQQTFHVLVENSRQVAQTGREQRRYSYDVPNQWQDRFDQLKVIGRVHRPDSPAAKPLPSQIVARKAQRHRSQADFMLLERK